MNEVGVLCSLICEANERLQQVLVMESKTNRNKQVQCNICFRMMQADTLKRHMRKHRELHNLDECAKR